MKNDVKMSSIKKWMDENKWSISKLASEIGISRAAVYLYLKGETCPNTTTAMKIRKITGLRFSQIIDCSDQEINDWNAWLNRNVKDEDIL